MQVRHPDQRKPLLSLLISLTHWQQFEVAKRSKVNSVKALLGVLGKG